MRVAYAGVNVGTCLSRLKALRTLEPDVVDFFIDGRHPQASPILRLADRTVFFTPELQRLNKDFIRFCSETKPDVVWVDKSVWIWPSTLKALRHAGIYLAHHFTDAIYPRHFGAWWAFHLLRRSLPLYHINFTSNIDDVAFLRRRGDVTVELTYLACDHERFNAAPLSGADVATWTTPMIFIGHHEPRTERYVRALLSAGIPIKVYGAGWTKHARKIAEQWPAAELGLPLSDSDYVKAIKGAKIALCCVSEWNYNQTAARSFEIPACGTFLLAMRTPQHLECYREGHEAEFFDTPEELVHKARHYLAHDDERQAIAAAGQQRCVSEGYTWERYMREDWAKAKLAWETWRSSGGSK